MRVREVFCVGIVMLGCRRETVVVTKECDCACTSPSPSVTTAQSVVVEDAGDAPRTCKVRIKVPTDAKVKVGKNEVTVSDGAISLQGPVGSQFFVSVLTANKNTSLVQPVFMTDDGCLPDDIDAFKGVDVVKKK